MEVRFYAPKFRLPAGTVQNQASYVELSRRILWHYSPGLIQVRHFLSGWLGGSPIRCNPSLATPKRIQEIHRLVFLNPFGKTICHKIQSYFVLQEGFEAGEHQREPLSRVGYLFHKFVPVAREAGFRDADERSAFLLGRESPFHCGEASVTWPCNDNTLVRFDGLHSHRNRDVVHFPLPLSLFSILEPSAAFGEPKFRGDIGVHKGLEYLGDRLTNQHSGF